MPEGRVGNPRTLKTALPAITFIGNVNQFQLRLERSLPCALFGRGLVQLKQGQKDAAQKDFDTAVAAQPDLKNKVADALKTGGVPATAGRATTTK